VALAYSKSFGRLSLMKVKELPNDIEKLKSLLFKQDQQLHKQDLQISELKDIITILQRKKFAPSSESNKDQLQLFNELEDIIDCDDEEEKETEVKPHTRKKRGKRKPLPENLRRVDDIYDLSEDEKEGMKCIGEEVSEQLVIAPADIYVKRTIRKKYAPINSNTDKKLMTAIAPEKLLPKTMARSSLIAYIITAKYVDALPLY
jgi:hypothetical protein